MTTEWEEQSVTFNTLTTESSFVVFQPGTFDGEIQIKWVRVSHSEAPSISWWTSVINNGDLEGDDLSNFFATEKKMALKPLRWEHPEQELTV